MMGFGRRRGVHRTLRAISRDGSRSFANSARHAFTIIDLLVTIAVVGILIAILMPSLTFVRESANQVVCRSNVRQIGLGIALFAQANDDAVMPSVKVAQDPSQDRSWDTVVLRIDGSTLIPAGEDAWDGIGLLYSQGYLPAPKLFYCPSHRGSARFAEYSDCWAGQPGEIVANYQYRARAPMADAGSARPAPTTIYLAKMAANSALVSDGLKSVQDFNHRVGANLLRADLSVAWFSDPNGTIMAMLAAEAASPGSSVQRAWDKFDQTQMSLTRRK